MLMPMFWFDNDPFFDPFDDVTLAEEEPDKDDVETMKSIGRHLKKEGEKYSKKLRHEMHDLTDNRPMRTDVVDKGDAYQLKAELPGFEKEDIHVSLKNGVLTVKASHKEDAGSDTPEAEKYVRKERYEASYLRSFNVDKTVKPEDITAEYKNGVLTLTVPKKKSEQEKDESTIEIQ